MNFNRFSFTIGATVGTMLMAGVVTSTLSVPLAAQSTNQVVASVLSDRRPPNQLSVPQLRQRLQRLERVIDARGVKKKWKRQAILRRQADRAELRKRQNGGRAINAGPNIIKVLSDRRRPQALNDTQLLSRLARLERLIDSRRINKRLKRQARSMRFNDRAELDRRRSGGPIPGNGGGFAPRPEFRVLSDNRRPRSLSDAQLLRRLSRLERVIDARGVSYEQKERARNLRLRDRAELDRRRQYGNGGYQPDTPVAPAPPVRITRVLNDNRSPRSLSDAQLLRRLSRLERVIDAYGVPRGQKSEARARRFADQSELNRRRGY